MIDNLISIVYSSSVVISRCKWVCFGREFPVALFLDKPSINLKNISAVYVETSSMIHFDVLSVVPLLVRFPSQMRIDRIINQSVFRITHRSIEKCLLLSQIPPHIEIIRCFQWRSTIFPKVILAVDMTLLQLIDLAKQRPVLFLMFYVIIVSFRGVDWICQYLVLRHPFFHRSSTKSNSETRFKCGTRSIDRWKSCTRCVHQLVWFERTFASSIL